MMSEKEETADGFAANFDLGLRQKAEWRPKHSVSERALKRAIDIVVSVLVLISHSWLYLIVWLCVRHTTGSPAIYCHRRIGRGGKEFSCLKFRSMQVNSAEILEQYLKQNPEARAEWERDFKLRDDPRVTKFGRIIRRTSLDELPQFWNVLKGEMSLVGPRPVVEKELKTYYGDRASYYMSVRPGITGPWQVGGRNDIKYERRVQLDTQYAKDWSVLGDIGIVVKTIQVVVVGRGSY